MNLDTGIIQQGNIGNMRAVKEIGQSLDALSQQRKQQAIQNAYKNAPDEDTAIQNIKQIDLSAGTQLEQAKQLRDQRTEQFIIDNKEKMVDLKKKETQLKYEQMYHISGALEKIDFNDTTKDPKDLAYDWYLVNETAKEHGIQMPLQPDPAWRNNFINTTKGLSGQLDEMKAKKDNPEDLGEQVTRLSNEFKNNPIMIEQLKKVANYEMSLDDIKIPGFGKDNKMANSALRGIVVELNPSFNPEQFKFAKGHMGSGGDYGTQKKTVSFANHAITLVQQAMDNGKKIGKKYYMPKPQLADLITSTVKVISVGQISDSQRSDIEQATAKGDLAKLWNYVGIGKPLNATTDDLIDLYADIADRQGLKAQEIVDSYETKTPSIKIGGLRYTSIFNNKKQSSATSTIQQTAHSEKQTFVDNKDFDSLWKKHGGK